MTERIWDFWAKRYERLWVQKFSLAPTRRAVLDLIAKLSSNGQNRFLDIGCGTGQLLADIRDRFSDRGPELSGLDLSQEMIAEAGRQLNNATLRVMDVARLSSLDGEYDIITCTHSLPYYPDQKKAISDMTSKLAKYGLLILAHGSKNKLYDALSLGIVKLTTGKAKYPSVEDIVRMTDPRLKIVAMCKLDTPPYVPTILVTAFQRSI